jgi:hypothetical protein
LVFRALALACRGHQEVVLENIALRHQLRTLKRTVRRPRLRTRDRTFWIVMANKGGPLAHSLGARPAGYGFALASRLAPLPMDSALETHTRRSPDR